MELYALLDEYMTAHALTLQKLYTQVFDQNKDNLISKEELVRGFGRITPVALTEGEVAALMNDVCQPGQNKLNFNLLKVAYGRYKEVSNPQMARRQLLEATESLSSSVKASYDTTSLSRKK